MHTPTWLRRLDQPWVAVAGLLVSLWLAHLWLQAARRLQPPQLGRGWSWHQQPPTIVVRFQGTRGCGCESRLKDGYQQCLQRGVAYVLVASDATLSRNALSPKDLPYARFVSEQDARFALPLAPGASETLLVVAGRVRKRWTGVSVTREMLP